MDAHGDDERPMRLAVVEILDRDGHTRQLVPVSHWPVTIGRAIECDVVLDDPHVAAQHATLDDKDGQQHEEEDAAIRVDQYLIVFLKFMASVTPGIEHDFTMGV